MSSRSTANSPDEHIAELAEPRRGEIRRIHDLIRKTVPELDPYMESGMIGYGRFHYRYASGREGDTCLIGLASNKRYISLYVVAEDGNGGTWPRPTAIGSRKPTSARAACGSNASRISISVWSPR